jgi:anti-sigma factor ChrR (cupin superfamily)
MIGHLPEVSLFEAALDETNTFSAHREVVEHLAACASCQARLRELREALTAIVTREESTPPPALREHILVPTRPFAGLSRRAGRLFDLDDAQVEKLLEDAIGETAWEVRGPFSYFHFAVGAAHEATTEAGIVRLEPGVTFPRHRHLGDEYSFVLQGCLREDSSGREALPGDLQHMPEGSVHTVTCTSERPCLFAVLLHGGSPIFDPS